MKKFSAAIMVLVLAFVCTITAYAQKTVVGDANQDTVVDVSDATFIQLSIANYEDVENIIAADVNDDGYVDIKDSTLIQKRLAGVIEKFPADPSNDDEGYNNVIIKP